MCATQSQGKIKPDLDSTVSRAVAKVEAAWGRPKTWQGTRHERARQAVTVEAKPGRDMAG